MLYLIYYFLENTLASMTFAPFNDKGFSNTKSANFYFSCFNDESMSKFTDFNLPHIEGFNTTFSQLKFIAEFLRSCFIESVLQKERSMIKILRIMREQILKGCRISFSFFYDNYIERLSIDEEIQLKQYKELTTIMGGEIIDTINSTRINYVTHYIFSSKKQPHISALIYKAYNVYSYFILYSYFYCIKMPENEFLIVKEK